MKESTDIKAVIKLKMEPSADRFYYTLMCDLGILSQGDFEVGEWNKGVVRVGNDILGFCSRKELCPSDIVVEVSDSFSFMLAWTVRLWLIAIEFDDFTLKRAKPS